MVRCGNSWQQLPPGNISIYFFVPQQCSSNSLCRSQFQFCRRCSPFAPPIFQTSLTWPGNIATGAQEMSLSANGMTEAPFFILGAGPAGEIASRFAAVSLLNCFTISASKASGRNRMVWFSCWPSLVMFGGPSLCCWLGLPAWTKFSLVNCWFCLTKIRCQIAR